MEELYEFLLEQYDYSDIDVKNKEIIVDIGIIGTNTYHMYLTLLEENTVSFSDMNGIVVSKAKWQTHVELKNIIEGFRESASSKPSTGDSEFDDIDIDDLMKQVKILKTSSNLKFKIFTYGCRNFNPVELNADLVYDVSKYRSHFPQSVTSVRYYRGTDELIQKMIVLGDAFQQILSGMIDNIEDSRPAIISIYCSHGKHRSVAFAELLKKYYYPKASIKHLCIRDV